MGDRNQGWMDGYSHAINQNRKLHRNGLGGGIRKDNELSLGQIKENVPGACGQLIREVWPLVGRHRRGLDFDGLNRILGNNHALRHSIFKIRFDGRLLEGLLRS